ncbi:hypothetical protein RGUI_0900 [Rhodovulum sp. P5]|uniref:metallophosphoesterase family protein n=1 Tax=Rhodovulum sp. P5 TaxID=1564506 RepID=UPI0009C2102D|nr:metallophosphoesterase [Rhodovulum sp. P5]ARE39041.1 hypothetical protein RGUI_0900 [Rhodovulum sp. P5]
MRIAIVADIHHGAPSLTKRGDQALPLLDGFADFVAAEAPDLVLDLGDRISDMDRDTDLRLAREVADALKAVKAPIHHVCGNHDRDNMTVAENAEILGQDLVSKVIDAGGWRIALWRAEAKITRTEAYRGFDLPEADLLWLAHVAASTDRPLLVVSHVPVSGHAQTGNYYFQRSPQYATYPQAERARAALATARHPVVCLAGHVHWNTITQVDGVIHLTQQSLTESFTTQGEPAAAWGMLELGADIHWQVHGRDPFELRMTPRPARWTPPLAPF